MNEQKIEMTTSQKTLVPFVPKTKLGKALWEARKRIVASGEPLLAARELMAALDEWRT